MIDLLIAIVGLEIRHDIIFIERQGDHAGTFAHGCVPIIGGDHYPVLHFSGIAKVDASIVETIHEPLECLLTRVLGYKFSIRLAV